MPPHVVMTKIAVEWGVGFFLFVKKYSYLIIYLFSKTPNIQPLVEPMYRLIIVELPPSNRTLSTVDTS